MRPEDEQKKMELKFVLQIQTANTSAKVQSLHRFFLTTLHFIAIAIDDKIKWITKYSVFTNINYLQSVNQQHIYITINRKHRWIIKKWWAIWFFYFNSFVYLIIDLRSDCIFSFFFCFSSLLWFIKQSYLVPMTFGIFNWKGEKKAHIQSIIALHSNNCERIYLFHIPCRRCWGNSINWWIDTSVT